MVIKSKSWFQLRRIYVVISLSSSCQKLWSHLLRREKRCQGLVQVAHKIPGDQALYQQLINEVTTQPCALILMKFSWKPSGSFFLCLWDTTFCPLLALTLINSFLHWSSNFLTYFIVHQTHELVFSNTQIVSEWGKTEPRQFDSKIYADRPFFWQYLFAILVIFFGDVEVKTY